LASGPTSPPELQMRLTPCPTPIQITYQPAEVDSLRLQFERATRQLTCSRPLQRQGSQALFLQGHPRDERFRPLGPADLLQRIYPSIDGLLGTQGLFSAALLDLEREQLSLFCDPFANAILYWYRDEQRILASDDLDWLARNCQCKLHIDWPTWCEVLSVHTIHGSHTYFEEIHCLELQSIAAFDLAEWTERYEERRRFLSASPISTPPEKVPAEIAAIFHEGLGHLVRQEPTLALALSGGMDSRMILASLIKNGARVHAFTTDTDAGTAEEFRFSQQVARAYGVEQTFIDLAPDWYEKTVDSYYLRNSFESWYHVWFQGLTDGLPNLGQTPLLTGNDGDGFLRTSGIPHPRADLDEMFSGFRRGNHANVFRNGLAEQIEAQARARFRQSYRHLAGLPGSLFFFRFNTRSRRTIHWMLRQLSARFETLSGFQYTPYVQYISGLPEAIRFDAHLQTKVMQQLDAQTLAYPATYTPLKDAYRQARMRKYNHAVLQKFQCALEGPGPLNELGLLDPFKTRGLLARMATLDQNLQPQFVLLQPLYMLARWLETYADLLIWDGLPTGNAPRAARTAPVPPANEGIVNLMALFIPVLESWLAHTPQGLQVLDGYESDYAENYVPAAGAVALALAWRQGLDVERLLKDYLTRAVQLLHPQSGARPFQQVFLLHYLSLALLLLPPERRADLLKVHGQAIGQFIDHCPPFNTNCAALKLGNELFLAALGIRPADEAIVLQMADHLQTAQLPSGFVNDQVERDENGALHAGDDMPIAYHVFILWVCICAERYGQWPVACAQARIALRQMVARSLAWLSSAETSDGGFAMAGRGKYHCFTAGVYCALQAYRGNQPGLDAALAAWRAHLRSDGTYDVTAHPLPHGLRAGYEEYARVGMYNTLGMAALAVAQDILEYPGLAAPGPQPTPPLSRVTVDADSGYAFHRQADHFLAVNLRQRSAAEGCLPMEGFHLRLDGQPTPLAEPAGRFDSGVSPAQLTNGVFEGWLAHEPSGTWHTLAFPQVAIQSEDCEGITLLGENERFCCEKRFSFGSSSLRIAYTLTPKVELDQLLHALPICMENGRDALSVRSISPQTANFLFAGRRYQLVCPQARAHRLLTGRSLSSVSGVATRLQYTLLSAPHSAGQPICWHVELTHHGEWPGHAPRDAGLQLEDPLSAVLGAQINYAAPLHVGDPVEIITQARGEGLEYAWYVLERQLNGRRKVFVQMYGEDNRLVWTPQETGRFVVMLFIRDEWRAIKSMVCPEVLEVNE
jgi:hypothetical protein